MFTAAGYKPAPQECAQTLIVCSAKCVVHPNVGNPRYRHKHDETKSQFVKRDFLFVFVFVENR